MERERGRFRAGVVDQLRGRDEGGQGGHGDDHAVVPGDDVREEGFAEAEVGKDVDGEDALEGGVGGGEDGEAVGETGVVDQDGGMAVGGDDGGDGGEDGGGGGEVARVVVDVGVCWGTVGRPLVSRGIGALGKRTEIICRLLDIEIHDLDILGREEEDDMFPYTIAAPRDDDKILTPVPLVALPVGQDSSVQDAVDPSGQPEVHEHLEGLQGFLMAGGDGLPFAGVAREEEERQTQRRVQHRLFHQTLQGVEGEAFSVFQLSAASKGSSRYTNPRGGATGGWEALFSLFGISKENTCGALNNPWDAKPKAMKLFI